MADDVTKRKLALEKEWPIATAAAYFDIPESVARDLMRSEKGAAFLDRFQLERSLDREDLIGLDPLALRFGLPRDLLEEAMKAPKVKRIGVQPFPIESYRKDGSYVIPRKLGMAWIEGLLPRDKVFSSLRARADQLATDLGGATRQCAVSVAFGEVPPAVATARCVFSWDDIALAHSEFVDNGKPGSLTPDRVGWHVLYRHPETKKSLWRSADGLENMQSFIGAREPKSA